MKIKIINIRDVRTADDILRDLSIKRNITSHTDIFDIPNRDSDEFIAALEQVNINYSVEAEGHRYESKLRLKSLIREIIKSNNSHNRPLNSKLRGLNEAAKGLNLETGVSNLFIKGWGLDKNGNMRIVVGPPNDKGFPIGTNGNLKLTDRIIKSADGKSLSQQELKTIGEEVTDWVLKYGNAGQKQKLRDYRK